MKAALKKLDIIVTMLAFILVPLSATFSAEVSRVTCHAVEERTVVLYRGDSVQRIPVEGKILRSVAAASGLYYCAVRGENGDGDLYLGFIDYQTGSIGFERRLPFRTAEHAIAKLMAGDGIVYLLAVPMNGPGAAGELFRIPPPPGEMSRAADILDFYADGSDCYMLANTNAGPRLVLNEITVPLALQGVGSFSIREVLDKRLVLVSSGGVTEVLDMRAGRSLYQYANDYEFLEPDGYNMIIQAVDERVTEPDDRVMIFYKVIIDGVETGRTDSGPAGLTREIKVMLEPNRYHQVRLERWLLNPGKGRYDRENNIRQPKIKEIYIPLNRIVKLVITFNNKEYSYTITPVYR